MLPLNLISNLILDKSIFCQLYHLKLIVEIIHSGRNSALMFFFIIAALLILSWFIDIKPLCCPKRAKLMQQCSSTVAPVIKSPYCPNQEPITWSLHPPYKPLESTLSDQKLFIEIAFAEYFSRLLSNIQSEQSYDHTSHAESQKCD